MRITSLDDGELLVTIELTKWVDFRGGVDLRQNAQPVGDNLTLLELTRKVLPAADDLQLKLLKLPTGIRVTGNGSNAAQIFVASIDERSSVVMTSEGDDAHMRKRRRLELPQDGPYILRPVIENVPLNSDSATDDVHITAVEHWSKLLCGDLRFDG